VRGGARLHARRVSTVVPPRSCPDPRLVEVLDPSARAIAPPVWADFISEDEEAALAAELEPHLRRRRYEGSHWDAVISKYRELQLPLAKLSPLAQAIAARVHALMPPGRRPMPTFHVLDLAADGAIGHHVDSVKFSGDVVAGISLLSDAVMQLRPDADALAAAAAAGPGSPPAESAGSYGATSPAPATPPALQLLLPRRSLYMLTGPARYLYGHALPTGTQRFTFGDDRGEDAAEASSPPSSLQGQRPPAAAASYVDVVRQRRISLIVRDELG
jgi:hypothetical protein